MKQSITITRRDNGYILSVAIGFVVFWFGEECERAIRRERKERKDKCSMF